MGGGGRIKMTSQTRQGLLGCFRSTFSYVLFYFIHIQLTASGAMACFCSALSPVFMLRLREITFF